jgi:hypothetical protein
MFCYRITCNSLNYNYMVQSTGPATDCKTEVYIYNSTLYKSVRLETT